MTLNVDGHDLNVEIDLGTDEELILLDSGEVSRKLTFAGTTHAFSAAGALWEIDTRAQPGPKSEITRVVRDGTTVFWLEEPLG